MRCISKIAAIILLAAACTEAPDAGSEKTTDPHESTYAAVSRGISCSNRTQKTQLDCTYKVGRDLELTIAGVGSADAGITINRVNGLEGEYYATIGAGSTHHCVIVKPGNARPLGHGTDGWDLAFISPQTGKVYKTWQECPPML